MSFERESQRQRSGSAASVAHDDATPGKRTLTQGLTSAVQRSTGPATADPTPAKDSASAQLAAIHSGGNRIERVFGGHQAVQRKAADAPSTAGTSSGSSSGGHVTETTIPFTAVIQRASDEGGGGTSDGKPRPESASGEPPQAQPPGATSDPQGNAPLYIAQMGGAPTLKQANADAVAAAIAYKPTTGQGGVTMGADEFGKTEPSLSHFSNVLITPGSGKFTVTAELKQTVKWDTRATEGPNHQKDVGSDSDPVLTKTSYPQAVTDLTPDLSDLKGRPPRTKFWAKDLTVIHEKYHVKDCHDVAKKGAGNAKTWLAGKNRDQQRGRHGAARYRMDESGLQCLGRVHGSTRRRGARLQRRCARVQGPSGFDQGQGRQG